MAENIYINHEKVREDAECVEGAAAFLKYIPLSSQDARTTLPASVKSRISYEQTQKNLARLGASLNQEAQNIRSLNVAFAEFDRMSGEVFKRRCGS